MISRLSAALCLALLIGPVAVTAAQVASQNLADMPGGHYTLDKHQSSVTATVTHMGVSLYTARFNTADATLDFDPGRPEAAKVRASVDPASLDVGADYSRKFAEDFLQATHFPKITFVSTQVLRGAGSQGTMTGDLTVMGVTKPVTFDVTFIGAGKELMPPQRPTAGFVAVGKIKRSDFASTYLDNVVGDEVTIRIEGEFDH